MSDITAAPSGLTAGSANRALRGPHHLASTRKPRPIHRGPLRPARARTHLSLLHAERPTIEGAHR